MKPEEEPHSLSAEADYAHTHERIERPSNVEASPEVAKENARHHAEVEHATAEHLGEVKEHLGHIGAQTKVLRKYEKDELRRIKRNTASTEYDKRLTALSIKNEAVRYTLNRLGALGVAVGLVSTFFVTGTALTIVLAAGMGVVVAGWGIGRAINAIRTRLQENGEHKRWNDELQEIEEEFKNIPDTGY